MQRLITQISKAFGDGARIASVGENSVTRIEEYTESGSMGNVPHLRVYVNDKVLIEVPKSACLVTYEVIKEPKIEEKTVHRPWIPESLTPEEVKTLWDAMASWWTKERISRRPALKDQMFRALLELRYDGNNLPELKSDQLVLKEWYRLGLEVFHG